MRLINRRFKMNKLLTFFTAFVLIFQPLCFSAPTALNTSTYDAFGAIFQIDTDTALHIFRVSTSHDNTKGSIIGQKYTISTGTWGSQYTIYTDSSYDSKGGGGLIIGSKIYFFFARKNYAGGPGTGFIDVGYIVSTDLTGTSWSAFTSLFTPPSGSGDITSAGGFNVFGNGWCNSYVPTTCYQSWYGHNDDDSRWEIRLFKTTDGGTTWTDSIQVYDGTTNFGESAFVNIGENKILGLSRNNSGGKFNQWTSIDGGETWTNAGTSNIGNASAVNVVGILYDADFDDIIIPYQDRSSSGSSRYVTNTAMQAFSNPTSYSTSTTLETGYTGNGYHVALRVSKNQVLMAWSKEVSSSDADIMYEVVTVGGSSIDQGLILS